MKVVAPIRETVSQTLASLLIYMPRRSLLRVHSVLLQMIRQNFAVPADSKTKSDPERLHVWEVRHAGLLGIKYEVAVRNDLFNQPIIKQEDDDSIDSEQNVPRGVVGATILRYVEKFSYNFILLLQQLFCFPLVSLGDREDKVMYDQSQHRVYYRSRVLLLNNFQNRPLLSQKSESELSSALGKVFF